LCIFCLTAKSLNPVTQVWLKQLKKQAMKNSLKTNNSYLYGFHKPEKSAFKTPLGINRQIVEAISSYKNEPEWMRKFRLQALKIFQQKKIFSGNTATWT